MRNFVFISLNKDIFNNSKILFEKNKFSLKYLNKYCGYYICRTEPKLNIWITAGIYNKHNLMVYDKIEKAFLVISEDCTIDSEFWNNLKISYGQLKKISKKISMISIDNQKTNIKRSLLQWCIENNNMEYIEVLNGKLNIDNF